MGAGLTKAMYMQVVNLTINLWRKKRAQYKEDTKKQDGKGKVFTMDYWWEKVKDQPKWQRLYMKKNDATKRGKLTESETYMSSSSQDKGDSEMEQLPQPQGQKAAKRKGKAINLPQATCQIQPCNFIMIL